MNRMAELFFILAMVGLSAWACVRAWKRRKRLPGTWLVEDVFQFAGKPEDEPVTIGRFRN